MAQSGVLAVERARRIPLRFMSDSKPPPPSSAASARAAAPARAAAGSSAPAWSGCSRPISASSFDTTLTGGTTVSTSQVEENVFSAGVNSGPLFAGY
jgi:hypothetical protein